MSRLRLLFGVLAAALPMFALSAVAQTRSAAPIQTHQAAHQVTGSIIVPAADFLDQFPAGDSIDGRFPEGQWFFNNNTINLATPADAVATVHVKEPGTYRLFVRSIGTSTSSFQVSVNGKLDPGSYGQGALQWKPGGTFDLKPGSVQIRLTSIHPKPSLDVLVLSKNTNFKEDSLKALELPPDVKLLREYTIRPPHILKFGNIEGNGRYALFDITSDYSAYMYDNDGKELWHWTAPAEGTRLRAEFEAPGVMWDFNHDGRDEAVHWREIDGKEWLVMADGRTGEILRKTPWPAPPMPHVFNNYRLAVAKFHPGPADDLLVLSDTGGTISLTAYDKDLKQIWQHSERRAKDYFGHYIYPVDVTGDGIDEVFISHLCLDSKGNIIWNNAKYFHDNHDHMDSMEFMDINGDGKLEQLVAQSDVGTLAYNAQTGSILWQNLSDHTQQITAGYILAGSKTPQVVSNGRTYMPRPTSLPGQPRGARSPSTDQGLGGSGGLGAQLYWFDNRGNLLSRWPANPLNGNPNFVRGDWYGTGKRTYFWYRFKLDPDGKATRADAYKLLYAGGLLIGDKGIWKIP